MTEADWWVLWDAFVSGEHEHVRPVWYQDWETIPRKLQHAPELRAFLVATHPLQSVEPHARTVRDAIRKAWGVVHYSPRLLIPGFPTRAACMRLVTSPNKVVHARGLASCLQCAEHEPRGNRITTVGHQ